MITKPEVFIIESLKFENEAEELLEGQILSKMLSLSKKRCVYFYIRTRRELCAVMKQFAASHYRYLHLSCHGGKKGMATTLDILSFQDFAQIIRPHLDGRRLFLSACSMSNSRLARLLMPRSGCISILGPSEEVGFNDAAVLWASLYHVMFAHDKKAMKGAVLRRNAQGVADLFKVRLNYFGRDSSGFTQTEIVPRTTPAILHSESGVKPMVKRKRVLLG